MEKLNFVRNGVIKLPPGFRFHPTDEELVVEYLKRKVFMCPLPASIIPEVDVCKYDPWDLPGDSEEGEKYFFTTREAKYQNGKRSNRATGSGYWKATGLDKQIVDSSNNQVVGMKKTLVFYRKKSSHGSRTDWVMHEYRLAGAGTTACIFLGRKNSILVNYLQNSVMQMEDWVICRIFQKKRSTKNDGEITRPCNKNRVCSLGVAGPGFIDFMSKDKTDLGSPPSPPSSSCSSGITEVLSIGSDHEESGSCNSFSSSSCRKEP